MSEGRDFPRIGIGLAIFVGAIGLVAMVLVSIVVLRGESRVSDKEPSASELRERAMKTLCHSSALNMARTTECQKYWPDSHEWEDLVSRFRAVQSWCKRNHETYGARVSCSNYWKKHRDLSLEPFFK